MHAEKVSQSYQQSAVDDEYAQDSHLLLELTMTDSAAVQNSSKFRGINMKAASAVLLAVDPLTQEWKQILTALRSPPQTVNTGINGQDSAPFRSNCWLPWRFGQCQDLLLECNDQNGNILGSSKFQLASIVALGSSSSKISIFNTDGITIANAVISIHETSSAAIQHLHIGFKGEFQILPGEREEFSLVLSRHDPEGSSPCVYKSEICIGSNSPEWQPFDISSSQLCSNCENSPIVIEAFVRDATSSKRLLGTVETTLAELKESSAYQTELELVADNNERPQSRLYVHTLDGMTEPSFFTFLSSGLQIDLTIAVDFTESNKQTTDPNSLHSLHPDKLNSYETMMVTAWKILSPYKQTMKVPMYGFGAKLQDGTVSHCFALNGDPDKPQCCSVDEMLQAYHQALDNVAMHGPTKLAPVINLVASSADLDGGTHGSQTRNSADDASSSGLQDCDNLEQRYQVLLILTDGETTDVERSLQAIIQSSRLPMSILIAGIGVGNFSNMQLLDSDAGLPKLRGKASVRDNVQFATLHEFHGFSDVLLSHLLAGIPDQVVSYMRLVNRAPLPQAEASDGVAPSSETRTLQVASATRSMSASMDHLQGDLRRLSVSGEAVDASEVIGNISSSFNALPTSANNPAGAPPVTDWRLPHGQGIPEQPYMRV